MSKKKTAIQPDMPPTARISWQYVPYEQYSQVQRQAWDWLWNRLLGPVPSAPTAETHTAPETASASAPTPPPKPSARTKRHLARLLKEQRATQADSGAEEADA